MKHLINTKALTVVVLSALMLGVLFCYISLSYRGVELFKQNINQQNGLAADDVIPVSHEFHLVAPDHLQYEQPSILRGRTDVVTVTPWLAPVVWEGTFNPVLLDSIYKSKNITVSATVFAVGKYIMFLKDFLETAEQHFFVGFKVHIYVFTDRPNEAPQVRMAAGRQLTVRSVPSSKRWQEISARRMELIQTLIEEQLPNRSDDYVFCLDVDSKFHGRWGVESLGGLVAVIHPGPSHRNKKNPPPPQKKKPLKGRKEEETLGRAT
ncbi:globoside alpha-1,3-N-acetylgalactosaminyltransferase 1-like [Anarrhichthys ocellatus]|uniref:globoside alpha-1,3-N-acetylgalactosaminyltransferase 1-like n=1 Tax=Anarrhichthys ocellatus TaxID=433405 RepID=UPI0012EEB908|nr:globoside alpha-1,3-N-acetylgalactosaminyltransferase 1-like [Anarrhichthys ocellatus]XP_031697498.1 globoside alpha-1,3-N-acetylgalactosaminyltransferase 1-like [Anarrhichthys ocellatus]